MLFKMPVLCLLCLLVAAEIRGQRLGSKCTVLTSCDSLKEVGSRPALFFNLNVLGYLMSLHCDESANPPTVRCPERDELPDYIKTLLQDNNTRSSPNRVFSPEQHRNYHLLPANCGAIKSEHDFAQHPWIAHLQYQSKRNKDIMFKKCLGSIINQNFVLTSASCLQDKPSIMLHSVLVGEHNLNTERKCVRTGREIECAAPPQTFGIAQKIQHKHFDQKTMVHNVGLIRLATSIYITASISTVQPICLPVEPNTRSAVLNQLRSWSLGSSNPEDLQSNAVTLVDDCTENMDASAFVCAQLETPCQRTTAGGPLYQSNKEGRSAQYAVAKGVKCAGTNTMHEQTLIAMHIDWILDNIGDDDDNMEED